MFASRQPQPLRVNTAVAAKYYSLTVNMCNNLIKALQNSTNLSFTANTYAELLSFIQQYEMEAQQQQQPYHQLATPLFAEHHIPLAQPTIFNGQQQLCHEIRPFSVAATAAAPTTTDSAASSAQVDTLLSCMPTQSTIAARYSDIKATVFNDGMHHVDVVMSSPKKRNNNISFSNPTKEEIKYDVDGESDDDDDDDDVVIDKVPIDDSKLVVTDGDPFSSDWQQEAAQLEHSKSPMYFETPASDSAAASSSEEVVMSDEMKKTIEEVKQAAILNAAKLRRRHKRDQERGYRNASEVNPHQLLFWHPNGAISPNEFAVGATARSPIPMRPAELVKASAQQQIAEANRLQKKRERKAKKQEKAAVENNDADELTDEDTTTTETVKQPKQKHRKTSASASASSSTSSASSSSSASTSSASNTVVDDETNDKQCIDIIKRLIDNTRTVEDRFLYITTYLNMSRINEEDWKNLKKLVAENHKNQYFTPEELINHLNTTSVRLEDKKQHMIHAAKQRIQRAKVAQMKDGFEPSSSSSSSSSASSHSSKKRRKAGDDVTLDNVTLDAVTLDAVARNDPVVTANGNAITVFVREDHITNPADIPSARPFDDSFIWKHVNCQKEDHVSKPSARVESSQLF